MSDELDVPAERLAAISVRLERIAAELRDRDTDDRGATDLAAEAAELTAEAVQVAGSAIDQLGRP